MASLSLISMADKTDGRGMVKAASTRAVRKMIKSPESPARCDAAGQAVVAWNSAEREQLLAKLTKGIRQNRGLDPHVLALAHTEEATFVTPPDLQKVRQALNPIPASFAGDIVAERNDC